MDGQSGEKQNSCSNFASKNGIAVVVFLLPKKLHHPRMSDTSPRRQRKELNDDARLAVYSDILEKSVNDQVPRGTYAQMSAKYGVCKSTVRNIWQRRKMEQLLKKK